MEQIYYKIQYCNVFHAIFASQYIMGIKFVYSQIYGTLTLGLSMVGYMMMCYGTCQLATLLVVEKLHLRLKPIVAVLNGNEILAIKVLTKYPA